MHNKASSNPLIELARPAFVVKHHQALFELICQKLFNCR